MAGKGSKRRPTDRKKYEAGYDAIKWKRKCNSRPCFDCPYDGSADCTEQAAVQNGAGLSSITGQ